MTYNQERVSLGSWKRFSLREAMIATVAICALLALYQSQQRSVPSSFWQELDMHKVVEEICQEAGLECSYSSGGGGSTMASDIATKSLSQKLDQPDYDDIQKVVMVELRKELTQRIAQEGGRIEDEGLLGFQRGPSGELTRLGQFRLRYRLGRATGVLRAYSFKQSEQHTRLLITLDEF